MSQISRPPECTFSDTDWEILSRHWFPIAVSADLNDRPLAARLLDVDLVIFRIVDKVCVALDRCPHRGMLLSRGWLSGEQIVCPYHGLHFSADGLCRSIPSQPDARIPARLSLTTLSVIERFGLVWTSLAAGTPALPKFDAWDDAGYQQIVCPTIDIEGSSGRQVEGFLDVSHFAWAHTTTFGDRSNPLVPDYTVDATAAGCRAEYISDISNYGPDQRRRAPPEFRWRRSFEVFPPFAATLVVHYPGDEKLWILNAASPVSARKTRLFCPIARNFDTHIPVEDVRQFNLRVFNEDRALVEAQRPLDLPLNLLDEMHIAADKTSIAYRRLLKKMGLTLVSAR